MGMRKIPVGTRSVTGKHAMGGAAYESSLERDLITLFQFDRNVEKVITQPVTINYSDDAGKSRRYTPDVLAQYCQAAWLKEGYKGLLCEVKYRDELKDKFRELKPRFKAAIRYAKSQECRFKIFTDKQIRTPYLFNARFLLPYRDNEVDQLSLDRMQGALSDLKESDPNSLLAAISRDKLEQAALIPALWKLVSNFRVGVDLTQPLTMASRIWKLP